ncbi:hypothetical protein GW17_00030470 [Ensete ventricosum]|nr:hypothetical protein GW17_00030470 [Ensete ventricosum]
MIHMGFSGVVAFFLVRVFKVVAPVKMTFQIYATCVIPISAFFASSLWFAISTFTAQYGRTNDKYTLILIGLATLLICIFRLLLFRCSRP